VDARPFTGKALRAAQLPPASINAYEGSVRSGKTFTSLLEWVKYCRQGPPGLLLMTGRTERTIVNNLILPLQELLGTQRVRLNRGTSTVDILGRPVLLIGANNEAARTKIQGLTLAGAYADEASTLPESYFNMLYSRLSVPGARMWLSSNPEGPVHWLKVKWLDRARLWVDGEGNERVNPDGIDLHRVTFRLDDNPNLPADYVTRTKAAYTGLWYRRYINAEWVAAEGSIYDQWDPDRHVVPHELLPPMRRLLAVGVDHGTTNASAGILLGLGADRRLYAIDEWWVKPPSSDARLTVEQQSESLRAWLAAHPPVEWLILDPAAAAFKVQLFHDRVHNVTDADNSVVYGISTVASLLGTGQLKVSDRCKHLIEEIPSYVWDDKAAQKGEDKPVKVNDHASDALRYAVTTTESLWRGQLAEPVLEAA